ncbi:hypothetical protein J6590_077642 [Homalodisca vitripennis]|nr:hypothetical protein J6590_077642 [Homalodisca vitripennis]
MGLTQEIIIPCYLDRTALKWYENIEERLGAALTWEQLKAAMKDAFKTIAWEEQLGVQITNAYAGRGRVSRGLRTGSSAGRRSASCCSRVNSGFKKAASCCSCRSSTCYKLQSVFVRAGNTYDRPLRTPMR